MVECFIVYSDEIEGRIDPFFYRPEFIEIRNKLKELSHQVLDDIIDFSSETWNQKNFFDNKFPYIEISEIDIVSGEIKNIIYCDKQEAPSRAKMIVRKDDILISTTRPHRGAISLIDESKSGFIASTGFAVLRKLKTTDINRSYLFYVLRTKFCLNQMLQRSSGGNYPAITSEELKKLIIPVPSTPTQNRIVEIMESAYSVKKQKEAEAQQLLDSINDYVLGELGIEMPELKDEMFFIVNSEEVEGKRADAYYYQPGLFNIEDILNCSSFHFLI